MVFGLDTLQLQFSHVARVVLTADHGHHVQIGNMHLAEFSRRQPVEPHHMNGIQRPF